MEGRRTFTLPAQVIFCIVILLFSFISALNPLGLVGLPTAILAAAMTAMLALSWQSSRAKLLFLVLLSVIPFAAATVYHGSLSLALAALFPLAMALPIFLTVRMGMGRAASIAGAAIGGMVVWLAYFALAITAEYGACNAETIGQMLDTALTPVKEMLSQLTFESETGVMPYYNAEDIELLLYYTKTLLLGVLAAMMLVNAYFVTLAARLISGIFDVETLLPMSLRISMRATMTEDGPKLDISRELVPWRIEIDSVTAGVFIAAYVVSLLLSFMGDGALTLYSALQNLVVILAPGFLYSGARDILLSLRGRASFGGLSKFALIFGAVLIFINPSSAVTLISALGVIVTLRENRLRRHSETNTEGKE